MRNSPHFAPLVKKLARSFPYSFLAFLSLITSSNTKAESPSAPALSSTYPSISANVDTHAIPPQVPQENTAHAGGITLKISGQGCFSSYLSSQEGRNRQEIKYDKDKKKFSSAVSVTHDATALFGFDPSSNISFEAEGKSRAQSLEYGAKISLAANMGATRSIREAFLKFKFLWGDILVGNTYGVEDTMSYGAFDVSVGSGQIDGGFNTVLNPVYGIPLRVQLVGSSGKATKLTYISPRVAGFQIGISFTPSTKHMGQDAIDVDTAGSDLTNAYDRNNIALGINYYTRPSELLDGGVSLTLVRGDARPEKRLLSGYGMRRRENTLGIALGGKVRYAAFEFGAEAMHNFKSRQFAENATIDVNEGEVPGLQGPITYQSDQADAGKTYSAGVAYHFGNTTFAYTGLHTSRETGFGGVAAGSIHSLGAEMKIPGVKGVAVFCEFLHINQHNPDALKEMAYAARMNEKEVKASEETKRSDNMIIAGIKVKF